MKRSVPYRIPKSTQEHPKESDKAVIKRLLKHFEDLEEVERNG